MRNLMISERVALGSVVELAQRATRSQLVQIGWIAVVLASPDVWNVNELLWGSVQALVLVTRMIVTAVGSLDVNRRGFVQSHAKTLNG